MMKGVTRVQIPGLIQCMIDIKPKRSQNEVYINKKMDVTNLTNYLADLKADGTHYTFFQAFVTAIAKVIYQRPKLNRFVKNRHMYEHDTVALSFVAKVSKDDKSEELMLIVPIDANDTMVTISEKVAKIIEKLRGSHVEKAGANSAIDILGKLPNIIRVPIIGIIKFFDSKCHIFPSLAKDNIFFTSMIISNLGSIHCGAIYHNLADFGTCSGLAAIGEINDEVAINKAGKEEVRKLCEFGITLDERIGDGVYFAKCANMIEYVLQHPALLNQPVSEPFEMK